MLFRQFFCPVAPHCNRFCLVPTYLVLDDQIMLSKAVGTKAVLYDKIAATSDIHSRSAEVEKKFKVRGLQRTAQYLHISAKQYSTAHRLFCTIPLACIPALEKTVTECILYDA